MEQYNRSNRPFGSPSAQVGLGRWPYRDIFIHYGPLQDIVRPLIAFRIWGTTYAADQWLTPWLVAIGEVFLLLIVWQITRHRWWALGVGSLFCWRTDLFIPDRVFPLLLTVGLMCRGLQLQPKEEGGNQAWNKWLLAAGGMAVATALYSFEIGCMFWLGLGTYFLLSLVYDRTSQARRRVFSFTLGLLIGLLLLTAYLLWTSAFLQFLKDIFALLTQRLPTWADSLPSHFFHWRFLKRRLDTEIYFYIHSPPVLSMLVITYLLSKRRWQAVSARWHQALLLACLIFFQFFIYIGRSDFIHWKNVSPLLWPLLALVLDELLCWVESPRRFGFGGTVEAMTLAVLIGAPVFSSLTGRGSWTNVLTGEFWPRARESVPAEILGDSGRLRRLGPLPLSPDLLAEFQETVDWIHKIVPLTGYFFNFTNYGGYYFLSERKNPTRFGLVNYIHGNTLMTECIHALAAHPPQAILVQGNEKKWIYRPDLAPLAQYILAHYQPYHRIRSCVLFVPKEAPHG